MLSFLLHVAFAHIAHVYDTPPIPKTPEPNTNTTFFNYSSSIVHRSRLFSTSTPFGSTFDPPPVQTVATPEFHRDRTIVIT